ncbi:MAG: DUF262 domain-containing protein [Brevinema sp.]
MNFEQKTVFGMFDGKAQYTIPLYQRAYSWGKNNWEIFLEDIREASESNNPYFYGNILLETVERDRRYSIIDGQQRLTTLILFFYSLHKILIEKDKEQINESTEIYETFIKNRSMYKLEPVSYDTVFFHQLLDINKSTELKPATASQKLLEECVKYFKDQLSKLDMKTIIKYKETISKSEIAVIKMNEKKESALMFELQNNRGLSLTNMEKLKSFIMYQIYIYSIADETENKLKQLAEQFEEIYRIIGNNFHLSEDSVLTAHCQAYINGFDYRSLEDIKNELKKLETKEGKIEWIKDFIHNLHKSFQIMKDFFTMDSKEALFLKASIKAFVYPFIIKGFNHIDPTDTSLKTKLIRTMEILIFRSNIVRSRADLRNHLTPILKDFNSSNIVGLAESLKDKLNQARYWRDDKIKDEIDNLNYDNDKIIKYILSVYEDIELSGQPFEKLFKNEQINIEHIYPQTEPDKVLENGYNINDLGENEDEEGYIHCIGNLVLIDKTLNSSIGNKPYKTKLDSYTAGFNGTPILQQQIKIKNYSTDMWNNETINRRHNDIVAFIHHHWSFGNIKNIISPTI